MSDDIGHDVLGTSINTKNGAISAQIGDSVSSETVADEAEWFQHVGFASRPSKAELGKSACQVLSLERTDRDVCYASRDLRGASIYGALGEGETCLYANGPNGSGTGLLTLKDDGQTATISISTKQGNASGGGAIKIEVSSAGTVTISAGPATLTVDQSGSVTIEAPTVNLGASGGSAVCVNAAALQAWVSVVGAGLNSLGVTNTPPVGLVSGSTKSI
jgi:hypothetical protein